MTWNRAYETAALCALLLTLGCGVGMTTADDEQLIDAEDTLSTVAAGVTAEADTTVRADQPTANFGVINSVRVGSASIETNLRFQVPDGPAVTRATLRLYVVGASVDAADVHLASTTNWSETTLTWNTRPAAGARRVNRFGSRRPVGAGRRHLGGASQRCAGSHLAGAVN